MKVIYIKRITDQIIEAYHEAKRQNREIEKVVLTTDEYDKLLDEVGAARDVAMSMKGQRPKKITVYHGVVIEEEKP